MSYSKILFLAGFFLLLSLVSCEQKVENPQQEGDFLIQKVEDFFNTRDSFPATLADLGMEESESDRVYYLRKADDHYIVWYGTSVGESRVWDSKTREWSDQ